MYLMLMFLLFIGDWLHCWSSSGVWCSSCCDRECRRGKKKHPGFGGKSQSIIEPYRWGRAGIEELETRARPLKKILRYTYIYIKNLLFEACLWKCLSVGHTACILAVGVRMCAEKWSPSIGNSDSMKSDTGSRVRGCEQELYVGLLMPVLGGVFECSACFSEL
jgi:hypothetical protein